MKAFSHVISDAALNCVCVCFLCLNLLQLQASEGMGSLSLPDKVTLLGCLSLRKWPARTKQFRILLSFKLEHIEGLLSDW